ncbi:MAG: dTDP-glucose 4,6-dehydratase [Candidatus Omnitrophica bacterium]|nr:dTDP-glucose 4,6-dehydratase [Candidatus Omnitrophota bacterium]
MRFSKILVTGGAGFIGSAFVKTLLREGLSLKGDVPKVIVVDKLTYAGDLKRLEDVKGKFKFYKADICDKKQMERIFKKEKPDAVLNFAASTHVDRSIQDAAPFIKTNIMGTKVVLDACRKYKTTRFIHISTDEVYGEIIKGSFSEDSPLCPNSPYAASKAAADLLIKSYIRTYNFPAIIIRPCNNYGPWQHPEKLIPLAISQALRNLKVPIYAKGKNVREWLYVTDCARAILMILEKGKIGETYNVGSGCEKQNIEIVRMIFKILKKNQNLIEFVKDRPGHDFRYALDSRKIRDKLGWQSQVRFEDGIKNTIEWYLNNKT